MPLTALGSAPSRPDSVGDLEPVFHGHRDLPPVLLNRGLHVLVSTGVRVRFVKRVPHQQPAAYPAEEVRGREIQIEKDYGVRFRFLDGQPTRFNDEFRRREEPRQDRDYYAGAT